MPVSIKSKPYCKNRLAKHRTYVLTVGLLTPLLLIIPVVYTQAEDVKSSTQSKDVVTKTAHQDTAATQKTGEDSSLGRLSDDSYGFEQLQDLFVVDLDLPTDKFDSSPHSAQLIKFSSLTPSLLALIFEPNNHLISDKQNYRVIDAHGRLMPTAIRAVFKNTTVNRPVPAVSVETDNPNAVEKLRHALRIELANVENSQSVDIDLGDFPSNVLPAVTNSPIRTWWLANPNRINESSAKTPPTAVTLWLKFSPIDAERPSRRPLQLQVYGSDNLQSWQLMSQSVVSPFENTAANAPANSKQSAPTGNAIAIEAKHANYRYWQVIANQPINLQTTTVSYVVNEPNYFLTRANFSQDKKHPSQWRFSLPQPILASGMNFFVPENQLWQVTTILPKQEAAQIYNMQPSAPPSTNLPLASAQVDKNHTAMNWQPTLMKTLILTGQMQQDDLPVNLLTPMYEMYFLAQGTAPYQLVINDPETLKQPAILLSDQQISRLGNPIDGQMAGINLLENPEADLAQYKKWGLWAVLSLIVLILSLIAYRLYQQTTTKPTTE